MLPRSAKGNYDFLKDGILLVITGPSGVGKDAAKTEFLKRNSGFHKIVTDTSRAPRPGEIDGVHHNFYTCEEFKQRIEEGKYLEYVEARPCEYKGTPKEAMKAVLEGKNVLWQIDEYAMAHLEEIFGGKMHDAADRILSRTLTIYIAPEDWDQLKEQYFARESQADKEKFLAKLKRDQDLWELYHDRYDCTVVNKRGQLGETVKAIEKIVEEKEREWSGQTTTVKSEALRA